MNNRRTFLKKIGLSSAALIFAEKIFADPYQPLYKTNPVKGIIKVTGHVKFQNKGVKGVTVSDGISVTATDESGHYSLLTDSMQKFIFISVPSGYKIPQSETGTAKFFYEISPGKDEQSADFQIVHENESNNEHAFFVLPDPQTHDMDDIGRLLKETVPDVKKVYSGLNGSVFGIACGDIMDDNLELYPKYEKAVKEMGLPFFQVFGNHDAEVMARTDEMSIRTFQKHFGPGYYSFNKGEIHYVVLDDVFWFGGYIGYISQQQLDWLAEDLKFIESGKTVVVFAHIPVYSEQHIRFKEGSPSNGTVVTNRELLYKILEPYKSYLICGHTHESEFLSDGNCEIHVGGAVCGGWWSGDICHDGTPNGYTVYNVNGSELKWQYKSTGKDFNHQMRLYKQEKNILANVWFADKDWKISAYAGSAKTILKQITGLDPLAIELLLGDDKPKKNSWVEPIMTSHLYTMEIPLNTNKVTVEAIDKWGRIYTEEISI